MADSLSTDTTDTASRGALAIAQAYANFIEIRDRDGVSSLLADNVTEEFPIGPEASGRPLTLFVGKEEVLDYTYGLFRKFSRLKWPNADWSESADGKRAFMEARGDAIVSHSGAPYNNVYITRYDVEDGLITQIKEYANPTLYMSLGIDPSPVELRATERCQNMK